MDKTELVKIEQQLGDALATLHEAKRIIERMTQLQTDFEEDRKEALKFLKVAKDF